LIFTSLIFPLFLFVVLTVYCFLKHRWQPDNGIVPLNWFGPRVLILVGTLLVIDWMQARRGDHAVMVGGSATARVFAYSALILITVVLGNLNEATPFIYFQF